MSHSIDIHPSDQESLNQSPPDQSSSLLHTNNSRSCANCFMNCVSFVIVLLILGFIGCLIAFFVVIAKETQTTTTITDSTTDTSTDTTSDTSTDTTTDTSTDSTTDTTSDTSLIVNTSPPTRIKS